MTTRIRPSRGYALLIVLGILAMAAVVGVGLARAALVRSAEASEAVERLQLDYGWLSARQAIIYAGGGLLDLPPEAPLRAPAEPTRDRRALVRLTTLQFDLVFADEQAKLNPNLLLQLAGESQAATSIRRMLGGSGVANRLRLRGTNDSPWPIGSYGQMLPGVGGEQLITGRPGSAPRDLLTPYGPGRVNLARAPEPVLEAMFRGLGEAAAVEGILKARSDDPQMESSRLLGAAGIADESLEAMGSIVADRSTCYSLWGTIRGDRRTWHRLAVRSTGDKPEQTRWYADQW